jgi:hypothetical protein
MIDFSAAKAISIPEGEVVKVEVNGITLWSKLLKPEYTNVLATALDYNGNVANNGLGYWDGYYLSGNKGTVTDGLSYHNTDSTHFLTGSIKYTKEQIDALTPLYIKGISLDSPVSHTRVCTYRDEQDTGSTYRDPCKFSDLSAYMTVEKLGEKYYKLTPTANFYNYAYFGNSNGVANNYIRFSFPGSGDGVIITVNEEIT